MYQSFHIHFHYCFYHHLSDSYHLSYLISSLYTVGIHDDYWNIYIWWSLVGTATLRTHYHHMKDLTFSFEYFHYTYIKGSWYQLLHNLKRLFNFWVLSVMRLLLNSSLHGSTSRHFKSGWTFMTDPFCWSGFRWCTLILTWPGRSIGRCLTIHYMTRWGRSWAVRRPSQRCMTRWTGRPVFRDHCWCSNKSVRVWSLPLYCLPWLWCTKHILWCRFYTKLNSSTLEYLFLYVTWTYTLQLTITWY